MDNEYVYYDKPTPKEPILLDEIEASLPMWENKPPAWKGSSSKSGRSEKQIEQRGRLFNLINKKK